MLEALGMGRAQVLFSVEEHLPSMGKTLSSIPRTEKVL
jgi:hypothetical protein